MTNMKFNTNTLILLLLVAVAVARLIPHPYNFTPIGAFALFSGAYITDKRFMLLPLVALLISDLFIGLYTLTVMATVYLGFATAALAGRLILARRRTPARFVGGVLAGAVLFYLISNLGVWWVFWPRTVTGLIECWNFGLPFLLRSVAGDFLYGAVIFGLVEWHRHYLARDSRVEGSAA